MFELLRKYLWCWKTWLSEHPVIIRCAGCGRLDAIYGEPQVYRRRSRYFCDLICYGGFAPAENAGSQSDVEVRMVENLLQNPGLEGSYLDRGAPQVSIAAQWDAWHDERLIRPEWQPETRDRGRGRVRTGDKAQKMAMTTAKFDGGIWQRVRNLTVGQWYRFSAWVYMWSSNQDNPDSSEGNGQMHVMAGANPWGHWPSHYATVWGKEAPQFYNEWLQIEVLFQAWHTEAAVMLRCKPEWAVKHNDVYWDDACLEAVDVYINEPPPPVEPPPPGEPGEFDYELLAELVAQRATQMIENWLDGRPFKLETESTFTVYPKQDGES